MTRTLFVAVALFTLVADASAQPRPRLRDRFAPPPPTETLTDATAVLNELAAIPDKGIPPAVLADAHGVVVFPRVLKAGFVVAGQGGHGVVMARKDGAWGPPVFVNLGGGSVGFQVGAESTDVVLVFRDRKSLDRVLEGKGKITLGADVSIAAGPVGRQAAAGTDAKLAAEIVSYSRSRGLFAGVAVNGAVIRPAPGPNETFRADTRPESAKLVADLAGTLETMSRPAGDRK